ncbi:MAG TPA: PEP-CTERM sorting domain-containing protein [Rhizomicrobium sp.]
MALAAAAAMFLAVPAHADLVTNGGFEGGNTGFVSGYTYESDGNTNNGACYPAGTYAIVTNANHCHSLWESVTPHSGQWEMVVNGGGDSSIAVWSETVSLVAGQKYDFSAWAASIYATNPADLEFKIGNTVLGTLQLDSSTNWVNFQDIFTASGTGNLTLAIYDLNGDPDGNDFALDDISLIPEPASLGLLGAGLLAMGAWRARRKVKSA